MPEDFAYHWVHWACRALVDPLCFCTSNESGLLQSHQERLAFVRATGGRGGGTVGGGGMYSVQDCLRKSNARRPQRDECLLQWSH